MRSFWGLIILFTLYSCDQTRVYEQQIDFENKAWDVNDKPRFEFEITDHTKNYNIYYTVRNSLEFPFSRIFITYYLKDSVNTELQKDLVSAYLFDQKTGEPHGDSAIGDLFDHRFPLLTNYHFERPGVYNITLEQFNRQDTLMGVLALGVRVEVVTTD